MQSFLLTTRAPKVRTAALRTFAVHLWQIEAVMC